jgi:hypothetical protein
MDEERMVTVSAADLQMVLDGVGNEYPDERQWEAHDRLRKVALEKPTEIYGR